MEVQCLQQLRSIEGMGEELFDGIDMQREQQNDPWITAIARDLGIVKSLKNVYFMEGEILYRRWKTQGEVAVLLVIPKHMRLKVLGMCHDDPMSGHLAFAKTWDWVRKRFFWPGSLDFTQRYVQSCPACQPRNMSTKRPAGPVQSFCPEYPFEMIAMDVLGPLP